MERAQKPQRAIAKSPFVAVEAEDGAGLLANNSCRFHLGQSTPFSFNNPSPQFMIAINPGNFGSLACPCACKMAALSSHAVRNRCDGSRRDEMAAGIGGNADDERSRHRQGRRPWQTFCPSWSRIEQS